MLDVLSNLYPGLECQVNAEPTTGKAANIEEPFKTRATDLDKKCSPDAL
jgi:hypothetical protein